MVKVWHYDGTSAVRHEADLVTTKDGFRLDLAGAPGESIRWAELVPRGVKNGDLVFGLKDHRGWQIGFAQPVPDTLVPHLPSLHIYGHWIDRIGLWRASAAFAAFSAIALFIGFKAPDWVAPYVPQSWERNLGDAMIGDFGGRFCNGPGSRDALTTLSRRIDPKGAPVRIEIANIGMVNAIALPGGKIVIFRGLLQESKNPDELAGVLGHEMGHVRNRDIMQALLRQLGLSVLLGGFNSDATGYVNALVSSTYSRDAEARADRHSINLMQIANVSPLPTAAFFARLAEGEKKRGRAGAALGYISSHPVSADREKAFRTSARKGALFTPAITPGQWTAILDSCHSDPNVVKDDGPLF